MNMNMTDKRVLIGRLNLKEAAHELGDIKPNIPGSPPVKLPAPTIRVDGSRLTDDQITLQNQLDLQQKQE